MKNEFDISQKQFEEVMGFEVEIIHIDDKKKVIDYTLSHCLDPRYDKEISFRKFKTRAKKKGIELWKE